MPSYIKMLFNLSFGKSVGTRWVRVGGRLVQVESGPSGQTWGVNKARAIYYRAGVTRTKPIGRYWLRIGGRLKQVAVGCKGVFGIDEKGHILQYGGRRGVGMLKCRSVGT